MPSYSTPLNDTSAMPGSSDGKDECSLQPSSGRSTDIGRSIPPRTDQRVAEGGAVTMQWSEMMTIMLTMMMPMLTMMITLTKKMSEVYTRI